MVDLKNIIENPIAYKEELHKRGGDQVLIDQLLSMYSSWKSEQLRFDESRSRQKAFNLTVVSLSGEQKQTAIDAMKSLSEEIKASQTKAKAYKESLDNLLAKIPSLTWDGIVIGKSEADNQVIGQYGTKDTFNFTPKPYWELPFYLKTISQDAGSKAMGARGYYMLGDMALFQRALFDYALEIVLKHGFDLMYVPLMLNENVLTGTGHIPDFDGQQYQVVIDENKSYYLIGSSEPSIMGYYMDCHVGNLDTPILNTCWSSCFRKEAGSYGKDQQGILRVHQFEKIEMVAIVKPEQIETLFCTFNSIVQEIYSTLGLHYQAVEVCSGDIPHKHRRQIDYEAWFPAAQRYREVCSNGNASDYQNRGLRISYQDENGNKAIPWGLNCTAVTFRTGLALLEQFQQIDGSIKLPEPLAQKMKKTVLL